MTASSDTLADTIREAIGAPAEHHKLCNGIRYQGRECDCYMRRYTPALDALDALLASVAAEQCGDTGAWIEANDRADEAEANLLAAARRAGDEAIRAERAESDNQKLRELLATVRPFLGMAVRPNGRPSIGALVDEALVAGAAAEPAKEGET